MSEVLSIIRAFGKEFSTSLYDTGFGDVMATCGIQSAETREDIRTALSFVNGYAQACRLANQYQSTQWLVCNDVAAFAGQLSAMLDTQEGASSPTARAVLRVIDATRASLQSRLVEKVLKQEKVDSIQDACTDCAHDNWDGSVIVSQVSPRASVR